MGALTSRKPFPIAPYPALTSAPSFAKPLARENKKFAPAGNPYSNFEMSLVSPGGYAYGVQRRYAEPEEMRGMLLLAQWSCLWLLKG